jgi:hypothetical protein
MGGIVRSRPMLPDLARLSEDELIDLNRRVVERLPLLRSAKSLAQLPTLSAGMVVEFDPDDGRTLGGTIARLNQRTATAVTASGRGYVLQGLPGVGPSLAPRLLLEFGSVERVITADEEELMRVRGVSR